MTPCTGFRLIQLLPVNDTCVRKDWRDSYPYSSLCVSGPLAHCSTAPAISAQPAMLLVI